MTPPRQPTDEQANNGKTSVLNRNSWLDEQASEPIISSAPTIYIYAGSDPERFGYGRYGQRAARIGPDCMCQIRLPASVSGSVFPKNAWIILRKTDPDPVWMVWSGFGQTHLVWKQDGAQESSGPVSGRTQPARYQFPTFRICSVLPQMSRMISYVSGFGQMDPVRMQAGVQQSSGPLLANAFQPIQTGCESDPVYIYIYIYIYYKTDKNPRKTTNWHKTLYITLTMAFGQQQQQQTCPRGRRST